MIKKKKKSIYTLFILRSLWSQLGRKRKFQVTLLLLLMILSSIAELVSLASFVPFLTIISNPEGIWKIDFINNYADFLKINNNFDLLLIFTIIFLFTSLTAGLIKLTNIWLNQRIVSSIGSDLSIKAYELTLYQPYEVHIRNNSSNLISALSTHIDLTQYLIGFTLQLITNIFISIGILGGILLVNWKIALVSGIIIGGSYLLVLSKTKSIIIRNSKFITKSINKQVKILQESLGGIRDIILDGSQETFKKIYSENDKPRRLRQANNQYFQQFPKSILESITILLVSFICIFFLINSDNKSELFTILGTLALGIQKLLPAFQQIYSSWVGIKTNTFSAEEILNLLRPTKYNFKNNTNFKKIKFNKLFELKNITYSYESNNTIFSNLNIKVNKGEIIGIIGETGTGKSTLVDLIMCLIKPDKGILSIDGVNLYEDYSEYKIQSWRNNISHIPQNIFLSDATISENIAFGITKSLIKQNRVREVAKLAQIHLFIENNLGGYDQLVGEKGIKLSGGQVQRIGIARALYKESPLLIMDEATSSLDIKTEKKIIKSILNLENKPTIIMISHRYDTLLNCDRIIKIKNGRIIKVGLPKDIIN